MIRKIFIILSIIVLSGCSNIKDDFTNVDGKVEVQQLSEKKTIELLEDGTGVILFAFPDCPWCQELMPVLNKMAASERDKVFYYNVLNIREEENNNYLLMYNEIVEYLAEVDYDILKYEKIWAPTLIAVVDGEIVDFNVGTTEDHIKVDGVLLPMNDKQENMLEANIYRMLQKVA